MGGIRRKCRSLLVGLFVVVCGIAGCSSEEPAEQHEETAAEADRREGESTGYDPTAGSWMWGGEVSESGESWSTVYYWGDYMLNTLENGMRITKRITALEGSDYYILERYTAFGKTGSGCQKYYLTSLDKTTLEVERKELKLQGAAEGSAETLSGLAEELTADMDENWLIVTGMSVRDGRLCLLALQMDRENRAPAHYYMVWLDAGGRVESAADLLPEIQRAGMQIDGMVPEGLACDRDNYYVGMGNQLSGIGIFDGEGRYLKHVKAPAGADETIAFAFCLPDGRPVFQCAEGEKTAIFYLQDLEEKMLYYGACDRVGAGFSNDQGEIIYAGSTGIMRWNVHTGERERIYQDTSLSPWLYEAIWETEDGGVAAVYYDEQTTFVQKLQPGSEVTEQKVVLSFLEESQMMQNCADEYSRQHPGIKIEVESLNKEEDYDTAFQRLAVQLASGEGPDMLVLRREQLEILQKKGVLAELTQLLPEEVLEQIFPGVLEAGSIDGTLYGIAAECGVNTLAVSRDLWQKDTWDYPDIIAFMEQNGVSGGEVKRIFGDMNAGKLLELLAIISIHAGTSSLVDEETGKCGFDTEEFAELLEFCKRYGAASGRDPGGESQVYWIGGNLVSFSQQMADLGEGYQCIGFPGNGSYGGFVECPFLIGVGNKTENAEIVRDFLQYVLSDRKQGQSGGSSVREDVFRSRVIEHTEFGKGAIYMDAAGGYRELGSKPDGSSYLPEYLDILEKGADLPVWNIRIGGVILEEAETFFNGDKTAEAVAEVIQNRVQLYLNE